MEQINMLGTPVTLIHLVCEADGKERVACMPGMTEFHRTQYHPNYQRTNDVRAATCPQCIKEEDARAKQGN